MSLLILGFFTFVLILVCAFLLLIILMQKASSNSGMGATLGGGAAESALGGGAGNVLTKGTIWGVVIFFVVAFGLYLGHMKAYVGEVDRSSSVPSLRGIDGGESPEQAAVTPSLTEFEIDATVESTDGGVSDAAATETSVPAAETPAPAAETPTAEVE